MLHDISGRHRFMSCDQRRRRFIAVHRCRSSDRMTAGLTSASGMRLSRDACYRPIIAEVLSALNDRAVGQRDLPEEISGDD